MASSTANEGDLTKAPRPYRLVTQETCTDWHGALLNAEYKQHLIVGCVIRVIVEEIKEDGRGGWEAIYLELVEVRDNGELVGTVEPTNRSSQIDYGNGLQTGDMVVATRDNINEIPLQGWQPEEYLEAVKHLKPEEVGYGVTGLRGLPDAGSKGV